MKRIRLALVITIFSLALTSVVHAQAQRMFVSTSSSDTNPCSRSAPCRNFAAAINAVAAGGEVIVLDSGGYGLVTISKSVSLVAPPGVYAGMIAFSGNTIMISTGAADKVTLRGLTLIGLGSTNGISISAPIGSLYVENCIVEGFSSRGITITASGYYYIKDSLVRN